jgi:hypothetical protein
VEESVGGERCVHSVFRGTRTGIEKRLFRKMSPAAEAQPAPEASGEGQEALAESKARSVISYSPEEIFQKSWQVRREEKRGKN